MPLSFRDSLAASTSAPTTARLPLCHVASCSKILGYIEAGYIDTDEICDVFNKPLNYFFYGRAAYRPQASGATDIVIATPAALVISPTSIASPHSVYPFDTGGYPRYGENAHSYPLTDFAMFEDVLECERIIERHWRSHDDYSRANLDAFQRHVDADCAHVECYSAIARDTSSAVADDRRSSLEVTSLGRVPINYKNINAVILPYAYSSNRSIQALQAQGVAISKVSYRHGLGSAFMSVVLDRACEVIVSMIKQ